ncbi:protein PLASTID TRANSCRIPTIONALLY ACTIVE 16, chloroplastic-like [Salvia splendens]|uniref:protein PLASTID TRANSCRIPTIONALLY ACTIVE 16, chloroplastic-like n=1 Tax=Salvia splendens TaxID=180675 RepID=UPI0011051990|nr:protein PLASTID TRANSCRIPTIONALLY ACTIVE 16, chloroplastic-like [Salvia splendens]
MAPTLSSNSFLLTTTIPPSRTALSTHRPPTIFAKKSDDEPQNSTPFRFDFDFGKLPDVTSLVPVVSNPSSRLSFRRKDPGTVFVAGATGQAGIRIAQTLLRQGFSVRAGVPDLAAAQELALLAAQYKIISAEESKRLNAVASAFDDAESIAKAIGSASKVVVTIGAGENGPSAQVSTLDALLVVEAAKLANVGHVAIVYDEAPGISSTYNVLDGITSFFNNLFAKSQPLTISEFLQSVVKADVAYTLIKTKLTEDFSPESSYNLVVSGEGSAAAAAASDYKVARSQIASLVADVFSNTEIAENKVVEVSTDPSAPSKAVYELLSAIPEDGRRKAYAEALAKEEAEEEALRATEEARKSAETAKKVAEEEEEDLAASLSEAQKKAGESVESFLNTAKGFSSGINWDNLSSQLKSAVQKNEEADEPKVQVATVRGQAKARSLPSLKAVMKKPARTPPVSKAKDVPKPKAKEPEPSKETRKVFGGLFKQETIYIDDD